MNDKIYKVIIAGIVMVNIILLSFFSFSFTEEPPITYEPGVFILDKDVYKRGETITFDLRRCSSIDGIYQFTQQFKNLDSGQVTVMPSAEIRVNKGCDNLRSVPKDIPEYLEPGRYRIEFAVVVEGKFKSFIIDLTTEEFIIE